MNKICKNNHKSLDIKYLTKTIKVLGNKIKFNLIKKVRKYKIFSLIELEIQIDTDSFKKKFFNRIKKNDFYSIIRVMFNL